MAHVDAGKRLHLQRTDGAELRFSEGPDFGDGELGIGAGLGVRLATTVSRSSTVISKRSMSALSNSVE